MLLLDNSAFARLNHPALPAPRRHAVAQLMRDGELAACLPFLLEAGYSARSGADHRNLMDRLQALPFVAISASVEQRALDVQLQLGRAGHHRLPPADVIIAACAEQAGADVLHYDADFDVIAHRTDLRFASDWLVPRGSL